MYHPPHCVEGAYEELMLPLTYDPYCPASNLATLLMFCHVLSFSDRGVT